MSERVAWFHCFAGVAGDMALGSLLDAGAPVDDVGEALSRLPIEGISLRSEKVLRAGLSATRAVVDVVDDGRERSFADIVAIVETAPLPARVAERSLAVFRALAEAEGAIHGEQPDKVHFHEVGGHDAIADVVGTATALELLGVDVVTSGPVATGIGTVRSAHGVLPNPAPAVLALLRGAPVYGRDLPIELTTPTGAAIVSALSGDFGPMPAMTLESTGYGAGTRDLDGVPNVTQVVIGVARDVAAPSGQPLALIETNLDDVSGEQLADALSALLEAGALDAWITPVVMKKGRPGHLLSALVEPTRAADLQVVLLRESGSFGARQHLVDRYATARRLVEVEVDGEILQIKVSAGRAKVEHDDALRVARQLGRPVAEVTSLAEAAYRAMEPVDPAPNS